METKTKSVRSGIVKRFTFVLTAEQTALVKKVFDEARNGGDNFGIVADVRIDGEAKCAVLTPAYTLRLGRSLSNEVAKMTEQS